MSDNPSLATLADALEAALKDWDWSYGDHEPTLRFRFGTLCQEYFAARRAAHDAGYVEVMVSRKAVAALRAWDQSKYGTGWEARKACELLCDDLAPLLKGG